MEELNELLKNILGTGRSQQLEIRNKSSVCSNRQQKNPVKNIDFPVNKIKFTHKKIKGIFKDTYQKENVHVKFMYKVQFSMRFHSWRGCKK